MSPPPKLARMMTVRAFAISQGVPLETMRKRIMRLEAEGPCPWLVRSRTPRRGAPVLINVEMMRTSRPELFEPVCLEEQVNEHEDKIDALAEVLRGHETRLRVLETKQAQGSPNFPARRTA